MNSKAFNFNLDQNLGVCYTLSTDTVVKVVLVGNRNVVVESRDTGNMDTFSFEGMNSTGVSVVSVFDTRWWLKYLPDASIFKEGHIACDDENSWFWTDADFVAIGNDEWFLESDGTKVSKVMEFRGFKGLPKIKDYADWKDTKISVSDLCKWQKEHKNEKSN